MGVNWMPPRHPCYLKPSAFVVIKESSDWLMEIKRQVTNRQSVLLYDYTIIYCNSQTAVRNSTTKLVKRNLSGARSRAKTTRHCPVGDIMPKRQRSIRKRQNTYKKAKFASFLSNFIKHSRYTWLALSAAKFFQNINKENSKAVLYSGQNKVHWTSCGTDTPTISTIWD